MKTVVLLFDSLNRHYLDIYNSRGVSLPNFERLATHSVTFDSHYAGSLPCMPARRELHTGRYNFLHSPWSPLQPFDQSVFLNISRKGVYTHLSTDHFHYWESGGSCYINQFDSFEMVRGQQGDPWKARVAVSYNQDYPNRSSSRFSSSNWYHDCINRFDISELRSFPIHKTFSNGLNFIEVNHSSSDWCLMIESFDPHEPFYVADEFARNTNEFDGEIRDWPDYERSEDGRLNSHFQKNYVNALFQCDYHLGLLLNTFDKYDLWADTMLIVTTDHGFMLGEKGWLGKNIMPMYEEVVHIPLWIYDPRHPDRSGSRVKGLTQTIDIASTVQAFYKLPPIPFAEGCDLESVLLGRESQRGVALFGTFGKQVGVTDGRYVLLKGPSNSKNQPLHAYTLMPQDMRTPFSLDELKTMTLSKGFLFAQDVPLLRVEKNVELDEVLYKDYLFDLTEDPDQQKNLLVDKENQNVQKIYKKMCMKLCFAMEKSAAPEEQFVRLGISKERT